MAKGYGKKKQSLGESFRAAVGGLALITAVGAPVGGAAYYNYGTVQGKEVTITSISDPYIWDVKENRPVYDYTMVTKDGLTLKNNDTWAHLKNDSDDIQATLKEGGVYKVTYYGIRWTSPVGNIKLYPNILSAVPVTPEELAFREAAAKKSAGGSPAAVTPGTSATTPSTTAAQPPAAETATPVVQLSGKFAEVVFVVDGYNITVTAPVEAVKKINVASVEKLKTAAKPTSPTP